MISGRSLHLGTERIMSRALTTVGLFMLMSALGHSQAGRYDPLKFRRISPQYIAALADPTAKSGNYAESWGLWRLDPGPRGVRLDGYARLKAAGDIAPARWKFDSAAWWLEEHGLIMEKPEFPASPGKYLVTGDREVTAVLTIHPR